MIGLFFRILSRGYVLWMALGLLAIILLSVLLAFLFGGRQPITTALDVGISVCRMGFPFMLVFGAQELFSKEFERRIFCLTFSYPISRKGWLFWRLFVLIFMVFCCVALYGGAVGGLVLFLSGLSGQSTPVDLGWFYVIYLGFFTVEMLVVLGVVVLLSVLASTPSFVLIGTVGFVLVARSYGAIVKLLSQDPSLVLYSDGYRSGLEWVGYFLPDLGRLDLRPLVLYGKYNFLPNEWFFLLLSNLGYFVAAIAFSVWVLQRKRIA